MTPVDLSQSIGDRMRRAARFAVDPNEIAPWTLPDAWTPTKSVRTGEVVSANGWWWVAQTGTAASPGITSAIGPGPATPYTNAAVADGSANWLALCGAKALANDPLAPTITRVNVPPAAPNNVAWAYSAANGGAVSLLGGYQNPAVTDRWRLATYDRSAVDLAAGSGGRLAFRSDAEVITLSTPQTNGLESAMRILVDGRYLTPSGLVNPSAASMSTILDWSAVGGKQRRKYEIEGTSRSTSIQTLLGIYTSATDIVEPLAADDDFLVYWIGDSQSAGHAVGAFLPGGGLAQRVARKLGWNNLWSASIGGTGLINPGTGPFYTYRQRVAEGLTRNPALWVFQCSTNDGAYGAAAVTAATIATIQAVRDGGNLAPIVFTGVEPVNGGTAAVEAAIAAGIASVNDRMVFFVPLSTLPVPPVLGAYNRPAFAPASVSNVGVEIFVGDGIHMMERTIVKRANLYAEGIKAYVLRYV